MIGKLKKGSSFGGCIRYVTGKDEAKILASDGVLLGTNTEMTQSFELQRQLNPRIKKPVGHIALSFKPEDKPRLTDEFMAKIALEYMQMMGINDTQFIIVRHHNTDNPHCHIVYNRINNEGKLISDAHDYRRNEQVTKALKSKYGLTYGTDKSNTNTRKLRNAERAKYEIHNAVKDALKGADSWQKFKNELAKRGVCLELVYKDKERTKVQGIRFCKDGYSFKGTQISENTALASWMQSLKERKTMYQQEPILLSNMSRAVARMSRCHSCRIAAKTLGMVFLPLDFLLLPTLRPLSLSLRMNQPRRKRRNAEEALAFDASYKPFKQQKKNERRTIGSHLRHS